MPINFIHRSQIEEPKIINQALTPISVPNRETEQITIDQLRQREQKAQHEHGKNTQIL